MSFQLGGLMSGLDTKTMIDQLMTLERKPVFALEERKEQIKNRNSAFQLLNTRLASLQSRATDLLLEKTLKAKSATSSDSAVVTATASAAAAAGSYKIKVNRLATSTSATGSSTLASAATGATTLATAKPANTTAITAGTFTLGGSTVTINSTSATLQEVVDAMNGTGSANVSVSGASGLAAGAVTLNGSGQIAIDVVSSPSIAIGGGGDTSNFLTISGLKSPSTNGTARIGARMNATQMTAKINDGGANGANLTTPVTSGTGSFKLNGVSISYNTATDTLNDVIGRINSSTAGVLASYNTVEDKIVLTNKTTGSTAITTQDVTGNFLSATGLLTATQTTGQNAQITVEGVNGGNPIESSTNEFKDLFPGVTFTAKKVETADWASVTIARDYETTINAIKGFITEFNTTVDTFEAAREKGKPLQNDGEVSKILNKIRQLVYDPISGLSDSPNTLSALGIGTTKEDRKHLTLDETKFKAALDANPDRVTEIFNKDATATNPTGMAGRLKKYLTDLKSTEGVFATRNKSVTAQTKLIDDQIRGYDVRIEQRRKILTGQFTAMEQAIGLMRSQQNAMLSQLGSLQQ